MSFPDNPSTGFPSAEPRCCFKQAGPPRCRSDHSRKNSRSFMKTNHQWTRIDQKTDGSASTTSGAKMLLQLGALGATMSWDDGLMRLWGHLSRRWEHPRQWLLRLAFRVPHSRQRMYMTWVNQWVMTALPPSMSTTSRTLIAVSITGRLTTGGGYRKPCGRCVATFTVAGPGRKSRANSTKTTAAAPAGTSHI